MNIGSSGLAGAVGRAWSRAFGVLFGRLQWTAPPWATWTGGRGAALGRYAAARPALTVGTIGVIAAIAVAGAYGWQWWKTRPKPVSVDFKVTAPARTDLENAGKPNPLVVEFARGVAPLALINQDVTDGIAVEPKIAGTWHWRSDRVLELAPKDDWPVGTSYQVTFGKNAVAPQIRLANPSFSFSSPPFVARITTAEFYQDPRDAAQKQAVVSLNFSHPVDPVTLEKRITLRMADASTGVLGVGAETTPFTLTYDKLKLNAFVHSQTLPIPRERSKLIVTVDKGVAATRGGPATSEPLTQSVDVPGIYSLTVGSVSATTVTNDRYGVEQVLVLGTSAAVNEKDMRKAIEAWVLPAYAPGAPEEKRPRPKVWGNPGEITAAVLQAGTKLDLEPIPAERENTEVHSFRYHADVGRYVYVRVEKGLRAFGGYLLPARAQSIQRVPPFPPELKILSQGALLSLSGEKKVAMMVRDLPGVRIEIGRVLPGQLQHLVSQSNGDFATPSFDGSFGPDNLTERFERKVPLANLERGKAHYEAIDFAEYLRKDGDDRRGIFLLSVSGYDPAAEQTAKNKPADADSDSDEAPSDEDSDGANENASDARNGNANRSLDRNDRRLIVVTDLGVIVKRELDGSQVAFVQSIKTGQPVPGVTVDVIAKNGTTLYSQATDAAGMTRFPRLEGLTRERAALMYVVHKAGDASFLPIARGDRMLDFSRFDIGGVANARQGGQLDAYLFSDRGIYRPGDTLHIGMIVKAADWTRPTPRPIVGLPLVAEVVDARGLAVRRENVKLAPGGFNELSYTTLDTAPTGSYAINLYTVKDGQPNEQIGTLQVRVQEFEPDRMKVVARFSSEVTDGWVSPVDLKARVNAQNLFGTPAESRRVEATLTLSPAFPAFRGYADYTFYDPQRAKESYSEKLPDGKTDAEGNADFDLGLSKYARATYRLHLLTRVFEAEGGRSVAAETASLVSELPFLVGFKADGDLGYVSRGAKRDVTLIAIDPAAKKTVASSLTLQLIDRRFVSVLTKQDNGTYRYQSRRKDVVLRETPLSIPAAGMTMAVDAETPGDFAYSIRNADGLEMNRIEYSVIGRGNVTRSLDRNAELAVVLDRKDYAPGDDIEVSIRAPYTGAGLITIERDKVYAQQWFKADTISSVQKVRLPKDFEGNGYINVQFVRDPASDEIFMSPLTYGVAPFAVSRAKRSNTLTLSAPDLVKPGQTLKIKLGVQAPTRAVVFAVDEGILQVARYQNADPLGHYFQKRALEVRTAQILDLILPEFKKLMAAAPGGDEAGVLGRHLNPFKRKRDQPAVYWSGIVDVSGEREFSYKVPDTFNGTLRIMAVAISDTMMGAGQRRALVRGDFVLSPNAPAMAAPGDQFDVSVGVANNVQGSGTNAQIAVTLAATPHLEVVGTNTQTLPIGEMREGVAVFRLKARDGAASVLGSATLTFTATLNGKSTALATDLSVRPATPFYTRLAVGSFTSRVDVPTTRDLFPEHRTLEASVSPLPLVAAQGLTAYLANFSHSCTEQLVSQAMPAVILGQRPEFARSGPNVPQQTLASAVDVLRTRQNAEGGFGLWAASVEADEYASVYATHLLLEARERGQNVPYDMLQKALDYLQQLAASPPADLRAARARAYAAYLLTRQGTVTTPMLTGIRELLDAKYPKRWQNDSVAAFLAASYQLMKQEKLASTLLEGPAQALVAPPAPFRYEYYYDPLIRDTQTLYIISRHFPDKARALPPDVLLRITERLAENQFNTLSAAYTILALDAYASTLGPQALGKWSIAELDAKGNPKPLELPSNLVPRVTFAAGTAKLRFGIDSNVRAYYAVTEAGFDRVPPATEQRNGIEVIREYVDASGKPLKTVKLGDEVTVKLRFRAIDRDIVPNLALVDLLPGGFEPVIAPPPPPPEANANDSDQEEAPRPAWVNRLGSGGSWNAEYADIRDDRIVLYGAALKNATEFVYKIKATNVGTFTAPPAYGESLYERSVQARSTAATIVVEKPGR